MTVNGARSDWAPVISGVPQRMVLGPLLFLLYVNNLPDLVSSAVKMFADDTKPYRSVCQASDVQALQGDLDLLVKCSDLCLLPFNLTKCHSLHFG